jgi:hypothetical protein
MALSGLSRTEIKADAGGALTLGLNGIKTIIRNAKNRGKQRLAKEF